VAGRIRHGRRAALAALAALGLAGAVLLGVGLAPRATSSRAAAAPSVATAPSAPGRAAATTAVPVASTPPASTVHVRVPALGLDLPVLPLSPRRGVIDPPLLDAAYWLAPYGRPGGRATNTVYLAAHADRGGGRGFDPLLTADHGGSALHAGDGVDVQTPGGAVHYTVDRTARYSRDELAGAADVWQAVPGRLVLITCLTPRAAGTATTQNLVVFAHS
jgi:sortase (surface protein transpeptidase)